MQAQRAFGWKGAADRLGAWNLYFVAKLALFALGLIGLHLAENLIFFAALFVLGAPRLRRFRPWVGVPVAIALLYYDSWLPGFARVVSQAGLLATFTPAYLAELAGRFVNWQVIAILVAVIGVFAALARFVRLDAFVAIAMVAMALALAPPRTAGGAEAAASGGPSAPPRDPDQALAQFFGAESQRSVSFASPPAGAPEFDVIFLHVCSLSWDDLEATGMDRHPLLGSFDIVLGRFNAVSTYSGPAAIRLLRAPCGQPAHRELYAAPALPCRLFPVLEAAGLEPQLAMNHDGHFDDFLRVVREQGLQAPPLPLKGIAAPLRGFDDSRIYDDSGVLARWLETRPALPATRAALYYNSVSLHDGNRLARDPAAKSSETYKARVAKVMDDLHAFLEQLAASGRRAVVVLVPEHGAAFRGDPAQIAGLREIPTPAITLVPVGLRVIGPDARRMGEPIRVEEPTSFLAVAHLVAAMLARPPFGAAGFRPGDYAKGMPTTAFVSEGETAVVLRRGSAYLLRQEKEAWKEMRPPG